MTARPILRRIAIATLCVLVPATTAVFATLWWRSQHDIRVWHDSIERMGAECAIDGERLLCVRIDIEPVSDTPKSPRDVE